MDNEEDKDTSHTNNLQLSFAQFNTDNYISKDLHEKN